MKKTDKPQAREAGGRDAEQAVRRAAPEGEMGDDTELSGKVRDYTNVLRAVMETPDIREDRVNEIKARIDAGNYNISPMDVAEKIVSRLD